MCSPGDEFIPFLADKGCDPGVIDHCLMVRDVAVDIARRIAGTGMPVRIDLVAAGAILHDIGRSKTHGMDHADAGGMICREIGFEEDVCRIVERHIGAGLSAGERAEFGLSPVDRFPVTLEEKIVAHADNMVKGSRVMNEDEFVASISRFPDPVRLRFLSLRDEIISLSGMKD